MGNGGIDRPESAGSAMQKLQQLKDGGIEKVVSIWYYTRTSQSKQEHHFLTSILGPYHNLINN